MKKENKKRHLWNIVLLILITGLVLFFALKDNFDEIMHELMNINMWWVLVGVFLFLGSLFLRSISLCSLIREFKPRFKMKSTFHLALVTQFFNAVTPFATGGQPFQVYFLKKKNINLTNSTNIIIQNFIVYQIALIILGSVAILSNHFFHIFKEVGILKELVTIGFIINTTVVVVLFFIAFAKGFNKFVTRIVLFLLNKIHVVKEKKEAYEKWEEYINNFTNGAKALTLRRGLMFKCILLNLAGLCALYIIPLVVAYSFGYYDSFNGLEAIFASAYVMLIGSFVPIPGGTGGLEYGFVQFYGNFVSGGVLNAMMLVWRVITYYFGMLIGGIALNFMRKEE